MDKFYKVFTTKPDVTVGNIGVLPPGLLNYLTFNEADMYRALKTTPADSLHIYDLDGQYYVLQDDKLVASDDPNADVKRELEPAIPPDIYTIDNAVKINAETGKPFEDTDKAPKTPVSAPSVPAPIDPITDAPADEVNTTPNTENPSGANQNENIEHHDELTPGEKLKLTETRANNT